MPKAAVESLFSEGSEARTIRQLNPGNGTETSVAMQTAYGLKTIRQLNPGNGTETLVVQIIRTEKLKISFRFAKELARYPRNTSPAIALIQLDRTQPMASEQQVRQYLAYWFQLGKRLMLHNGQQALKPTSVIAGDRYSDEFEACWNAVRDPESGDCYIEGTTQTIQELLSPEWEIDPCARCTMPVPTRSLGMPSYECPCSDLPYWPDTETPQPRSPVQTSDSLQKIRDRLSRSSH